MGWSGAGCWGPVSQVLVMIRQAPAPANRPKEKGAPKVVDTGTHRTADSMAVFIVIVFSIMEITFLQRRLGSATFASEMITFGRGAEWRRRKR